MRRILRPTYSIIKKTAIEWIDLDIARLGAALSFYALFSIAPLFVIVLAIAGFWLGDEAARRELFGQVSGALGRQASDAIQSLVSTAHTENRSPWAAVMAVAILLVTATGTFVELQSSLNTIWGVRRKPGRGLRNLVKDRLLSFSLIVAIGLLLLAAIILSESLAVVSAMTQGVVPGQETMWHVVHFFVSYCVLSILVAMIFKILPDVRLAWRDVFTGAIITALLFNLGRYLFGQYLIRIDLTSTYGAASSLVVVLLWIYYSSQVLLFGAKFTQVYSDMNHTHVEPTPGAEAVTLEKVVSQHRSSG
jgi:membrane protein